MAEKGTLSQLKERFDRKNVKKDVKKDVHACREFIRFITQGLVVLAVMKVLGMTDKDEKPIGAPGNSDCSAKEAFLNDVAKRAVCSYAFQDYDGMIKELLVDNDKDSNKQIQQKQPVHCGFQGCTRTFTIDGMVKAKHRSKCAFKPSDFDKSMSASTSTSDNKFQEKHSYKSSEKNQDSKYNYACRILQEGLLDWARMDASSEGDGYRTYLLWKYDLLMFKATGHTTYAALAFEFISQIEGLLSERKAAQLLHNRTINFYGGLSKNVPIDYAIELLNSEVKPDLKHKFGTLTEKTIDRVGKSVKQCKLIKNMVDIQLGTFDAIGRHEKQLFQEDVELMVKELYKENLFEQKAGRAHISFPNFRRSFTLKKKQFNDWLEQQKEKIARKQSLQSLTEKM